MDIYVYTVLIKQNNKTNKKKKMFEVKESCLVCVYVCECTVSTFKASCSAVPPYLCLCVSSLEGYLFSTAILCFCNVYLNVLCRRYQVTVIKQVTFFSRDLLFIAFYGLTWLLSPVPPDRDMPDYSVIKTTLNQLWTAEHQADISEIPQ